jgi:hypothetical protein
VTESEERIERALHTLVEEVAKLPSGLRQGVTDALWARIPTHVSESGWAPSASGLVVPPQTGDWELITSIITYVPATETGFIQLGNQDLIPVGGGTTILAPSKWMIGPGDARTLTIGTPGGAVGPAGLLYMHLAGERMPTHGVMGG